MGSFQLGTIILQACCFPPQKTFLHAASSRTKYFWMKPCTYCTYFKLRLIMLNKITVCIEHKINMTHLHNVSILLQYTLLNLNILCAREHTCIHVCTCTVCPFVYSTLLLSLEYYFCFSCQFLGALWRNIGKVRKIISTAVVVSHPC